MTEHTELYRDADTDHDLSREKAQDTQGTAAGKP